MKKTKVEWELLTYADMLRMVERGVRGGICHAVKRYAIANNKYMKDYDLYTESPYFMCRDVNNIHGLAMS